MNKFLSLTKLQLKDFLGRYRSGLNIKNNQIGKLLQLAVVLLLPLPAVTFATATYDVFSRLGSPELVITSMYVNSVLLMFFLGIPFIASIFFFSKDLKFLSSLPIKENAIVFAKLSTVYLYLLAVSTLLMGPATAVYGVYNGFSLQFIILGIIALILAPLLPLLISALLVLLINRFISISSRRNLLAMVGNMLMIVAIIGIQLGINRYVSNPEYIMNAIRSKEGLLGLIGMRFPPSIWLTEMVLGSFPSTFLFISLNLILVYFLYQLTGIFFRHSLLALGEGGGFSKGKIYYQQRSKGWQLLKRNILIIVKQPIFLLNTVLTLFIPVVMFMVMSFTGEISLDLLRSPQMRPYLDLIFAGILISPAVIANLSATAITREGKSFWETRTLPISSGDNIRYRVMTTVFLNLFASFLLLIIAIFLLPVSWKTVILGSLFCLSGTLFLATVDIIVNIYRPLLNWTHPTAAIKNNLNIMISLAIRVAIGAILYLVYKIVPSLPVRFDVLAGGLSIFFLLLYFITRQIICSYYLEKFRKIEIPS